MIFSILDKLINGTDKYIMFIDAHKLGLLKYTILAIPLVISSCASLGSAKKDKDAEVKVDLLILATPVVNPNMLDSSAPVRIDLLQLSDLGEFNYTDYLSLIEEENDLNGKLLSRTQHIIHPDELHYMNLDLNKETKYVGVVGGFREDEALQWKIELVRQPLGWKNKSKDYLYLKVDEKGVTQLSKPDMKDALKEYAQNHPEDETVSPSGNFKKPKYDYSKGMFNNQQ